MFHSPSTFVSTMPCQLELLTSTIKLLTLFERSRDVIVNPEKDRSRSSTHICGRYTTHQTPSPLLHTPHVNRETPKSNTKQDSQLGVVSLVERQIAEQS
jgi:hypothetical protein